MVDVNPLGPRHAYAPVAVVCKVIVAPSQYAPVFDASTRGLAFTMTTVLAFAVQPAALVATTVYEAPFVATAFSIVGFCNADVNPLGPFHANEVASEIAFNEIVSPAQYAPVFDAVTVGIVFTTTVVVASAVQLFAFVATTVYVPSFDTVEFAIVGFCKFDVNPLGPRHANEVALDVADNDIV
jgi:hypothetical protein